MVLDDMHLPSYLDQLSDAICICLGEKILCCNKAFVDLFGAGENIREKIDAKEVDRLKELIKMMQDNKRPIGPIQTTFLNKNMKQNTFEACFIPMTEGRFMILINNKKLVEKASQLLPLLSHSVDVFGNCVAAILGYCEIDGLKDRERRIEELAHRMASLVEHLDKKLWEYENTLGFIVE